MSEGTAMRPLYETPTLTVHKLAIPSSSEEVWISFGAANNLPFGEAYFRKIARPAFLVTTSVNHWYQQADTWDALATVKRELDGWTGRIVCYGSSMGGFAALAFSSHLGATHVIAASPQISISPEVVGTFDNRWTDIGRGLTFQVKDARETISTTAIITLLIDSMHREDRMHADLIAKTRPVRVLKFPNAGHACLHTLQEVGILDELLDAALGSDTDLMSSYQDIYAIFRNKLLTTCSGNFSIADYYLGRDRVRQALPWLRRILQINPGWPVYPFIRICLDRMGTRNRDTREDHAAVLAFLLQHGQHENALAAETRASSRFSSSVAAPQ